MRDVTYLFDILFIWSPPFIPFWLFGGSGKEFAHECLFYLIASLRTHIWFGHKLWILFASYWACEPICYSFDISFESCVLGSHVKHSHSLKTMLMLNAHPCISLIRCFSMPLTHSWLSQFLCFLFSCCSTIWLLQVLCLFPICALSNIEGVRIPCCAHCIQMQNSNLCTYLGELPHFI